MDYQYPPRLKILPGDFAFIGVCIAGALAALFFFWSDLNLTLSRLAEQPVGTVTYKYRAIQRRFIDRVLWERLRQESPVYHGDFVRTAELSEAVVHFFSGDEQISLEENTLIQIFLRDGDFRIDLVEGGLTAAVPEDLPAAARNRGLSINAGGAELSAAPGATVTVSLAAEAPSPADALEVQTLRGNAEIRQGNNTRTLAAGELYRAGGGGTARVAVLAPRPSAKILNSGDAPLPVVFNWNRIGFSGNDPVRLEIAEDRFFTRIAAARESGADRLTVELGNGLYYWRAYPASEAEAELKRGGVSGRLSVIYAPAPALISPPDNAIFSFMTTRPGIRFIWSACEGAAAYWVEIAGNPDMRNPVFSNQVQATGGDMGSAVYSGLEPGTFYWRVRPVYSRDYEGTALVSKTGSFRIEQAEILRAPRTQERLNRIYLEGGQENSYFTWTPEDEAVFYTFLLSRQEDLSNPLIERRVRDNYYAFNVKAAGLAPGQYYWGVYQTDIAGNDSELSKTRILVVMAGAPPAVPIPAAAAAAPAQTAPQAAPPVAPSPAVPSPAAAMAAVAPPTLPAAPTQTAPQAAPPAAPSPAAPGPATMAAVAPPALPAAPEQPAPQAAPPPLPAPGNLQPASGYVLTEEIIIRDQRIVFSWEAVEGASGYLLTLYQVRPEGNQQTFRQTIPGTSFALTDLTVLDSGEFVWQVEAENTGTERRSPAAESRFRVDISEVQGPEVRDMGVTFGTQ
jgi:hypothetical protein